MDEANTPTAAENNITAVDFTNTDQIIEIAVTQGPELAVKIVTALLIFFVGRLLARFVVNLLRKALARTQMEDTLERFLCNMAYTVLLAVVIIATIGQLGIETTSLLAVFGAAGLAVGLALQGSLSNFAAGVLIVAFRPYKVGDFVEVGAVSGSVQEVQIFTTVLTTPDNKRIIVPNSQVMEGIITNYSANGTRRVDLVFGCAYDDDIDTVYNVLKEIINNDSRILAEPEPTIALNELADSSVNFIVRPWVAGSDYWGVYNDITEQVKRRFDAAGISIPFPQQDVHLYQHGKTES
ncbi:MAG: mechanosensitive ion channel domain-containing protein [Gammaproteobacteria bacterium]|jgi:small conductance mechanosensitive channel|nr:mechanosensitive ion channel domain-containing protein [Gammaproteobacteria bacterium]